MPKEVWSRLRYPAIIHGMSDTMERRPWITHIVLGPGDNGPETILWQGSKEHCEGYVERHKDKRGLRIQEL